MCVRVLLLCVCMCVCVNAEASVSFAFCCYLALFNVISGTRISIDLEQLTNFLEQITQVLTLMKVYVCMSVCSLLLWNHAFMHVFVVDSPASV